jgi:PKD repeat protein
MIMISKKVYIFLIFLAIFGIQNKSFAAAVDPPKIEISASPVYGSQCLQYTFKVRAGGSSTSFTILWTFGDGNTQQLSSNTETFHGYLISGTYAVSARIIGTIDGVPVDFTSEATLNAIGNNNFNGAGFSVTGTSPTFGFSYTGVSFNGTTQSGHNYNVNFGDGTSVLIGTALTTGQAIASHTYAVPGNYTVTLTHNFVQSPGTNCQWIFTYQISVPEDPCCSNFAPEPTKDYWLSAWVQESVSNPVMSYSNNVYIELEFVVSGGNQFVRIERSGDIIEGWQRIVGKFTVPANATDMNISMVNTNAAVKAYFDDIRIHPFNGSMKSYVYNPETLLLAAELDDNNFATIYEYDKEGQLIRIKKETQRGIMTIEENRQSNPKP